MAVKSATVMSRIEPELKREAEGILMELGIPVSALITSLYKNVVANRCVPFTIVLPKKLKSDCEMTKTELNAKLEIGLAQIENGEGVPAEEVISDMRERILP